MTAILAPEGKQSYTDSAGVPLVGGKLYTYATGTVTPKTTWSDAAQLAPNANPIILDGRGECTVYWDGAYKVQLQDSLGNVLWTIDPVTTAPSVNGSLIPGADNTYDLGSTSFAWRQLYVGADHAPVLDTVSGDVGYFKRTAAEIAAGVTPTNRSFPCHLKCGIVLMERYGGAGDNATVNDTAMAAAVLVAGQTDCPIGFSMGTAGVWLFSAAWPSLTGTVQGYGGAGPTVPAAGTVGARVWGLGGRPVIKFSGLGAAVDCVTMGGNNLPQVELRNLEFNFNTTGRDGLVISGSNFPIIQNVMLRKAQRDGLVLSPNGTTLQWIEKGVFALQVFNAGRHACRLSLLGTLNPYINEMLWQMFEVRGISERYAGGNAIFCEAVGGLGGAAKMSDHVFLKTVWDCIYTGVGLVPDVSPIRVDSGVVENWVILNAAWENTGAVSPGVGFCIRVTGTGAFNGLTMLGSLTNSFWGSNGIDPLIGRTWNFDYSFGKTQLVGQTLIKGLNDNTNVLDLKGQTTAGSQADLAITRTGAVVNAIGQGANVILGNSTGSTFAAMQENNGELTIYTFSAGAWGERARVLPAGGIRLFNFSAVYSNTGVPGAGLGANGDFYFRQDGGAGTCIYQKRGGAWVATAA